MIGFTRRSKPRVQNIGLFRSRCTGTKFCIRNEQAPCLLHLNRIYPHGDRWSLEVFSWDFKHRKSNLVQSRQVRTEQLELETTKEILAEAFHARPADVEYTHQNPGRMYVRYWGIIAWI